MILKPTDSYKFVSGHAGRALLENVVEKRFEVWVQANSPGASDNLIWCFFKSPFWLEFDHVATDEDFAEMRVCVTPQAIDRFAGPDRFLSNFHLAEIMWEGRTYPSSEHLYQAMKARTEEEREWVRTAHTPREAKFRGRKIRAAADWAGRRIDAMRSALHAKFDQHPDLADKLDGTGDASLIEGNAWGDTFWGVDAKTERGENHLGRLLMELRAENRESGGQKT